MLSAMTARVKNQASILSELDSIGGDGDHGTTMTRAMNCVTEILKSSGATEASELLREVGEALLGVDGGAAGPLLGTFFMGMAHSATDAHSAGCLLTAAMLEAGLAALQGISKAKVGDKTIMDALVPAIEAFHREAERGANIVQAFHAAAIAARQGAEFTKQFAARYGRAKYLGARTVGYQDPGATSVALMFEGFFQAVNTHTGA